MNRVDLFDKALIYNNQGYWDSAQMEQLSYTENGHEIILNYEEISFWYQYRNEVIKNVIQNYTPKQLVDVGGGNGFVSKMLQDIIEDVIMVEPGLKGAHNAANRGVKNVYRGSIETLGLLPDSCLSIGLFDVIEHIEDDLAFLNKINRYLKQNGLCFITVPAYRALWSSFDEHVGHYRRYNLKTLKKLMSNSGFETLYLSHFFSATLPGIYFARKFLKNSNMRGQRNREHMRVNSPLMKLFKPLFNIELSLIRSERILPFGSSCVVVAKKV